VDRVAQWLDAHRPADWRPGLLHGDVHFANVLIRRDAPELAAFVDWELATVGDPLLDLGHMLATWPARQATVARLELPALPAPEVIVERYAEQADRDVRDVTWFVVLACYRLGIILEGSYARMLAGLATAEVGERLGRNARTLLEQAYEITG
jgi:aminoglycoside phosphotransferase (APT) family kinase protein